MAKSKKESVTNKVEAVLASKTKPSKKNKRDADVDVGIQKNPKKQKNEVVIQAEKKAKKVLAKNPLSKKDTDVKMAEAEQKSNAKQVKDSILLNGASTTQAQGGSSYKLFAGNLSSKTKKSDLENFFKEVGGEIKVVRLARGYGHVEFASAEALQKALKLNGKSLCARKIRLVDFNTNSTPQTSNADDGNSQRGEGSQVKTILVKRIGKSVVGEDEMKTALREHFRDCGEITRLAIPCDQGTGATKGMAFLDFNEDGFNKALKLNGSELGGRNIVVTEASTKGQSADRKSGSRQGRRRGRPLRQRRRDRARGNDDSSKGGPEGGDGDSSKSGPGKGNGETVEQPAKQV